MLKKIGVSALTYEDIKHLTVDGWINAKKYTPYPYDLVIVKLKNKIRETNAWYDGTKWCGLRLKKEDIIERWKRRSDE